MSLFLKLVKNTVCRSNHHRLAIDALVQLRGTDGELWRNLFLHHHKLYLDGAKAPDEIFKDFKNHVLHVREGDWGGAPAAAREWYRRTVRALGQQDWKHAVYCAGVMSHYVVDPVQPLHTGQTEEEGTIHRAIEWSFSKSYAKLQLILEQDLGGYPDVAVPSGNDWLEQMIRAGARTANPHYETLIDHYNLAAGVKSPQSGLDQELKDVVARLVGYATIMLSRILERAFIEAAVIPPRTGLTLDTLFATLKLPLNLLLGKIDDARERATITAMYEEFLKTGKVRQTLSEDDKLVRRLHALEVLKVPLSTIDALWPRETGMAHGTGRPARTTTIQTRQKPKPAKRARIEPSVAVPAEKPIAQQAKPVQREIVKPPPMPANPGGDFNLKHNPPVEDAPSIGAKTASRLTAIGVHTVNDLLSVSPEDAATKLKFKHINARLIRDWQAQAGLACTIPGLPSIAAQLLVAVGVRDGDDLANAEADMLINMIDEFCDTPDGQRILRDAVPPTEPKIQAWINLAQDMQKKSAA